MHLNWTDWKNNRQNLTFESKGQTPDYSFDAWLKRAKSFGDEISSFVGQAKEKDRELDDEIKKKKQEPKQETPKKDNKDDADDSDELNNRKTAWNKLRSIAKERLQKDDEKSEKSSDSAASS